MFRGTQFAASTATMERAGLGRLLESVRGVAALLLLPLLACAHEAGNTEGTVPEHCLPDLGAGHSCATEDDCPQDTKCNTTLTPPVCQKRYCAEENEACDPSWDQAHCFGSLNCIDADPPYCSTCRPDCEDKACGDDGCGGSCGSCGPLFGCFRSQCVLVALGDSSCCDISEGPGCDDASVMDCLCDFEGFEDCCKTAWRPWCVVASDWFCDSGCPIPEIPREECMDCAHNNHCVPSECCHARGIIGLGCAPECDYPVVCTTEWREGEINSSTHAIGCLNGHCVLKKK